MVALFPSLSNRVNEQPRKQRREKTGLANKFSFGQVECEKHIFTTKSPSFLVSN